ncbi:hypothetical protein GCM10009665_58290 [Kitasatospora nipponensis]|uniref:NB-ARC domain-containing protein n=1 Tax=Kitasatospora nipponensis TaxID=258049 RepID=A0ABN1WU16_9ACTN
MPVVTAVAALAGLVLGIVTSIDVAAMPLAWPQHHQMVMWGGTAVLVLVTAGLSVAVLRADNPSDQGGGRSAGEVSALVIGDVPARPPAHVHRGEADQVAEVFAGGGRVAVVCPVTGGRGVGKTQIAAQVVRQAATRRDYALIGWASGETPDRLATDLAQIAGSLGIADPQGDARRSALRLRDHVQSGARATLLVVDNAVSIEALREFLPAAGPVRVLVTGTDHSLRVLGRLIDVSVFERPQSIAYLLERTGRDDREGADLIARELGDLPLGLAQAAGLLSRQRTLTFSAYAQRIAEGPLSGVLRPEPGGYPRGVAEAILQSLHTVQEMDPSGRAVGVLEAIALLDPEGTSVELLRLLPPQDPGSSWEPEALDEILGLLADLSLLTWTQDGSSVVMHRLVSKVAREVVVADHRLGAVTARTMAALNALLPSQDPAMGGDPPHALAPGPVPPRPQPDRGRP